MEDLTNEHGESVRGMITHEGNMTIEFNSPDGAEVVPLYLAIIRQPIPRHGGVRHTVLNWGIGMAAITELLDSLQNRNETIGLRWPGLIGDHLGQIIDTLKAIKADWGALMDKVGMHGAAVLQFDGAGRMELSRDGERIYPTHGDVKYSR